MAWTTIHSTLATQKPRRTDPLAPSAFATYSPDTMYVAKEHAAATERTSPSASTRRCPDVTAEGSSESNATPNTAASSAATIRPDGRCRSAITDQPTTSPGAVY